MSTQTSIDYPHHPFHSPKNIMEQRDVRLNELDHAEEAYEIMSSRLNKATHDIALENLILHS